MGAGPTLRYLWTTLCAPSVLGIQTLGGPGKASTPTALNLSRFAGGPREGGSESLTLLTEPSFLLSQANGPGQPQCVPPATTTGAAGTPRHQDGEGSSLEHPSSRNPNPKSAIVEHSHDATVESSTGARKIPFRLCASHAYERNAFWVQTWVLSPKISHYVYADVPNSEYNQNLKYF